MQRETNRKPFDNPYTLLKLFGISRKSSMQEIDNSVFQVMKHIGVADGKAELDAVQEMKQAAKRLVVDFFLPETNPVITPEQPELEKLIACIDEKVLASVYETLTALGLISEQRRGKSSKKQSVDTPGFKAKVKFEDLLKEIL